MSNIKGGETEKLGNQYEDNVLVYYYGLLMDGEYVSVQSEAFDKDLERGGDIYLKNREGKTIVVQAKSRDCDNNGWTVSALIEKGIISNACHHIERGRDFYLASPLNCFFLDDLCRHAQTFSDITKLKEELVHDYNANEFAKLENAIEKTKKVTTLDFLRHFYLKKFNDDREWFVESFQSRTKIIYGDTAFQLLNHYAIKKQKLAQEIYANELWSYMSENGMQCYTIDKVTSSKRIVELSNEFKGNIRRRLIGKNNYSRRELKEVINKTESSNVVMITGKAGTGKSGVVLQLCEYFDSNGILYLPISLDAHMPECDSYKFGKQLGLSASPVEVLSETADGRNCFLIVDQIDAIRWNVYHSSSAFAVCCQLVKETKLHNNIKDSVHQ